MSGVPFFHNVDWCQLRDHSLPAPFSAFINTGPSRKRYPMHVATSHMASVMPSLLTGEDGHHEASTVSSNQPSEGTTATATTTTTAVAAAAAATSQPVSGGIPGVSRTSFMERTRCWLDRRLSHT